MQFERSKPLPMQAIWEIWLAVLVFFVIWIIRSLTYPAFDCLLDCEYKQALLILAWKTVVWFLMPIIYLWRAEGRDPFAYLGLKSNLRTNLYCLAGLVAIGGVWQAALFMARLDSSIPNTWDVLISIWGAGVCEEVLFRGFFLRKFGEIMTSTRAVLVTSILFVLAHVPGWVVYGGNAPNYMLHSGLYIFVISLILSMMVQKTKCLYPSIAFHIIADLIAF